MKKFIFSLLLIISSLVGQAMAASPGYIEGRLIVRFKADAYQQTAKSVKGPLSSGAVLDEITKTIVPDSSVIKTYQKDTLLGVIKLPISYTIDGAINIFINSSKVAYAEPDYLFYPTAVYTPLPDDQPNDPQYWRKWDHNIMQVRDAWGYGTGNVNDNTDDVRVAVIDTGVGYDHPDLAANIAMRDDVDEDGNPITVVDGYDPAGDKLEEDDEDFLPMDFHGHGTHVAGIIGAVGNNAEGVAGVNWYVSIVPIKVFADDSPGGAATSDIVAGINWAGDNNVNIINMSLGGYGFSQSMYNALAGLPAGVVVVAAAGNESNNNDNPAQQSYPASYDLPNIISVMSTDENDRDAWYTCYGATTVDIAAPGGGHNPGVYSTITTKSSTSNDPPFNGYAYMSGTSMAAPQVAGALALMKSIIDADGKTAVMWPAIAVEFMYLTADKLPDLVGMCRTEGRLNVFKAVEAISSGITNVSRAPALVYSFNELDLAVSEALAGETLEFTTGIFYAGAVTVDKSLIFMAEGAITDPADNPIILFDPSIDPDAPILTLTGAGNTFDFTNLVFKNAQNGAIYIESDTTVLFTGCDFADNTNSGDGGAVSAFEATVTFDDCEIYNNSSTSGSGVVYVIPPTGGGAIYAEATTLTVTNSDIHDNTASVHGGGIYAVNCPFIDINNSTMSFNRSDAGYGGGIAVEDCAAVAIMSCQMNSNIAYYNGGAVYGIDSLLSFTEVEFTNNFTGIEYPPYGGGAVYCGGAAGRITLEGAIFTSNVSASDGGAVLVSEAKAQIDETIFTSNRCLMDGGAVYIKDSPNATLANIIIENCQTTFFGGGISINTSVVEITNILMTGNSTYWWGGAIYVYGSDIAGSYLKLTNGTLDNNSAYIAGGGVFVGDNNVVELINSVFTNSPKYAVYEGGFVSDTTVTNSLFYGNPGGDFFDDGIIGLTGAALINTMAGSVNNIDLDPMYVDGPLGEHYFSHTDAGQLLDADGNIAAEMIPATTATSPCFDGGIGQSADYGLETRGARTDGEPDTGLVDLGFHYNDPSGPYAATEHVTITVFPVKTGTVTPQPAEPFKPYSHVILEATAKTDYMFYRWTTPAGVVLTQITEQNLSGDYYGLYDAQGKLMYIDNAIEGVPYRIVLPLKAASRQLIARFDPSLATLIISVSTSNGTIKQNGYLRPDMRYPRGQVVNLEATPDNPEHKISWEGTDEDSLLSRKNTVTLRNAGVTQVQVKFYAPQVWTVGPQGDGMFDSLQMALSHPNLEPGDIIQLLPGEHRFDENNNPNDPTVQVVINREVVIQGGDPGNPEATVIRDGIFVFAGVGRNTIVRDITFDQTNSTYFSGDGYDGCTPQNPYPDGDHGGSGGGAIMRMLSFYNPATSEWILASPTISNCRLIGGTYMVGDGGNGCIQDPFHGDGGWPGISYGGGVFIDNFCKPIFENCEFIDLRVRGGHGGNAASTSRSAMPGLWGDPTAPWWAYLGHHSDVLPGFNGDDDTGTNAFRFVLPHEKKLYYPAQEEKSQYAGRGGAMYIGIGAEPIIRNSRFENCSAMSGSSGIGLPGPNGAPEQHYRIPSYGGAVFCDAMSKPVFENTTFKNNIAHWEQPTVHPDGGAVVKTNDYQSNGGAVYAQRNSTPRFTNCYFEGNQAVMGGAIATDNIGYRDTDGTIESLIIEDCVFVDNKSDIGGAIASAGGINSNKRFLPRIEYDTFSGGFPVTVFRDFAYSPFMNEIVSKAAGYGMYVRSNFTGNEAVIQLADAAGMVDADGNVIETSSSRSGHGGAIAAYSAKTEINDCQFQQNMTGGFGGAIYVSGKSLYDVVPFDEYSNMYLRNCLVANNYAGLGGGGINIATYSDVQLINNTVAHNAVTIAGGTGGGIRVTDVSDLSVINSIFYGNICSNGSQIALVEPHVNEPSNADIRFSLIEPFVAEPSHDDTGRNAVRTINGEDEDAITVSSITDIFELSPFANVVTDAVSLGFTINFYEQLTNSIYVSDNGCVSFWKAITTFSEYTLNTNVGTPVIAVFHADVDTSRGNTVIYGRGNVTIVENGQYITCKAFFVNWVEVGYFSQKQDKLNTFQLVLIDRSDRNENDFDIEFNYDKIRWEAGENQGGNAGLGGTTARVGFSSGTGISGTFYELEGSGQPGSFLDNKTTALIAQNRDNRDVSAIGRLVFPVKTGKPQINYGSPVYAEGMCTINYDTNLAMWDPASQNITTDPLWAVPGLYYLSAIDAGQDFDSPAIDAGAGNARDYNIYRHTTRVDNRLDTNRVDMGFHYTLPVTKGLVGDFDFNGVINADSSNNTGVDWLYILDYWLDECDYPYWCHGTDINMDGIVNLIDSTAMAPIGSVDKISPQPLFGEDGLAVTPDFTTNEVYRMTWEKKPVSAGSAIPAITMTANVAMDNCIGDIEYKFVCTYREPGSTGGADRDWSTDRTYTDTGLSVGKQYAYVCLARDSYENQTLPSLAVRTYAGDDSEAPVTLATAAQPTKARWLVFPQTASIEGTVASVRMVAETAKDISGVQYFFECTSGNGNNSTWQDSPEYVDTGLVVGQLYTYRIKTRDKSRNLNEGVWSEPASVTPDASTIVDNNKPYPMPFITNAVQTFETGQLSGQNGWHNITAVALSADASYPVWYKFICLDKSSYSSPRIYKNADGTVVIAEMIDLTKKRFSSPGDSITWGVNVGFPGKTLNWKVICGDSAGTPNEYTLSDQPQKVTLGTLATTMRFNSVIDWVVTYPENGFIITHYPADFVDAATWPGGYRTIGGAGAGTGN